MGKYALFHTLVTVECDRSETVRTRLERLGLTVEDGSNEPEHDDEGDCCVHLRPPGSDEGASNIGDHSPVECEHAHTQTTVDTEERVDRWVVGNDPANPAEHAETREQESGNPIPQEASCNCNEEEALAGHVATVALAVVLVQSVEQSRVDERARPNHAGGPDDELAEHATDRKTETLRADGEEGLEAEGDFHAVEDLLGECDLEGVDTNDSDVRHDRDADMLLDGERTWVERPLVAEEVEDGSWKDPLQSLAGRQGDKLNDDTSDVHGRVCCNVSGLKEWRRCDNLHRRAIVWLMKLTANTKKIPKNHIRNVFTGMRGSSTLETAARTSG